jgi:hypothetical protein
MPDSAVRPLTAADSEWVKQFIVQRWGSLIPMRDEIELELLLS